MIKDIIDYSDFFKIILLLLDLEGDRERKFDKFLMMFGKYKVREISKSKIKRKKKGKSVEFEWHSLNSSIFDLDKIVSHANADVLFVCFLLSLEKDFEEDIPEKITIRDISDRIPKGTANISNYSSYNYAMIALFGEQAERDYFLFEQPEIKDYFTEQANNPLRNNNFWKKYLDETVVINPKYIL